MFEFQGIWLPDDEKHFPEWMSKNGEIVDGKGSYQIRKLRAALEHCKQFRVAVDVGGHVGLWSMQLAKRFAMVHAFEPVSDYRECFKKNVRGTGKVTLHDCALGNVHEADALGAGRTEHYVKMRVPIMGEGIDSGGTHVSDEEPVEFDTDNVVRLRPLDAFGFSDVDFLKIDCEGYEDEVIAGARETIRRCKPTIIVEQKPKKLGENYGITGTPAVDLLKSVGYIVRQTLSGDYILTK